MDVGCRDKRVNARLLRILNCFPGPVDIPLDGPTQCCDRAVLDRPSDKMDGFKISHRGYRKSCLDHIDAKLLQLASHPDFFFQVQAATRRLLAIAQRCVKNTDSLFHDGWISLLVVNRGFFCHSQMEPHWSIVVRPEEITISPPPMSQQASPWKATSLLVASGQPSRT